ncbi:hypothetical protein PRZ48_003249 [Zasmidium cellare]|uniref:Uncharacterized protein n=1 Tax=Zasmidium cellare TaxID=395010 RepID=A0ABR0EVS8_ZASCE|nr:hypothetical protein PRZ48_003249 [Zasmidium cellare]
MATSPSSQGDDPPSARDGKPPLTLSVAELEQVTALMTLVDHLTPAAKSELRRQLREHDNTESIFFKLPGELRNRIFEMAFLDDLVSSEAQKTTAPSPLPKKPEDWESMKEPTIETHQELKALLCGPKAMNTCRQMRRESRSLLGLDKIVVTKCAAPDEDKVAVSPIRLDEVFLKPGKMFFWVYLHESEDIASGFADQCLQYARLSKEDAGTGTVSFPSTLGIKPRSIFVECNEDIKDPGHKHRVKARKTAA